MKISAISSREAQIAALFIFGLSCSQIGKRLGISPLTVDSTRKHFYKKLRIGSVVELVHIYYATDWHKRTPLPKRLARKITERKVIFPASRIEMIAFHRQNRKTKPKRSK